jgi:tRNA pseudouridine55 synthase
MDGLLIVDKPSGPTSHDVVARLRRVLRERRIGHTGTLDPLATGVLPLVVGRATRLARFLSAVDKAYDAVIALGYATDTGDRLGTPIARATSDEAPAMGRDAIERALDEFRGTYLQQPPLYSAKKIGGRRSYALARAGSVPKSVPKSVPESVPESVPKSVPESVPESVPLRPVSVTVYRLEVLAVQGNLVTLGLDCSAGFYVRSLAYDLGERLGTGAHLAELRRTRSGDYTVDDAMPLDAAERDPGATAKRLIPLSQMLRRLPVVKLTADGARRARNGQDLGPGLGIGDSGFDSKTAGCEFLLPIESRSFVRLLDPAGELVGIAEPTGGAGLLHPFVVLG